MKNLVLILFALPINLLAQIQEVDSSSTKKNPITVYVRRKSPVPVKDTIYIVLEEKRKSKKQLKSIKK